MLPGQEFDVTSVMLTQSYQYRDRGGGGKGGGGGGGSDIAPPRL